MSRPAVVFGFVDETTIEVSSGRGGSGAVSFRREKYVPKGGPDGGDGGRGGDVLFVVRDNLKTLSHLKLQRAYHAENGEAGHKRKRHGRNGRNVVISVPPGTVLRDTASGAVVRDLGESGEFLFLHGGRGGQGNSRFSTARRQVPRFAQPGEAGVTAELRVELNLIADVGFVGYPNAGKSTLLSVLTNARPRVGDWPFTTTVPNLGMLRRFDRELVLADIPGIIKGASLGAGLGLQFLKHITRTSVLLVFVDLSVEEPSRSFDVLLAELGAFSRELAGKPRLVVGTKLDIVGARENLAELKRSLVGETVVGVSSMTHAGVAELTDALFSLSR